MPRRLRPERVRRGLETPESFYAEAERYYENAKECLKKAEIEYGCYKDTKPVKEACGVAYLAVLMALDGYFIQRGVDKEMLSNNTDGYFRLLYKHLVHNGKVQSAFRKSWENLHVAGYYWGHSSVAVIKEGFSAAKLIIDALKPRRMK